MALERLLRAESLQFVGSVVFSERSMDCPRKYLAARSRIYKLTSNTYLIIPKIVMSMMDFNFSNSTVATNFDGGRGSGIIVENGEDSLRGEIVERDICCWCAEKWGQDYPLSLYKGVDTRHFPLVETPCD